MLSTLHDLDELALRAWVRERQVCFEMRPHVEAGPTGRARSGIELSLLARAGSIADDPGSPQTYAVYLGLLELARRVVPDGAGLEAWPFDRAFRLRSQAEWLPEVELVAVIHGAGGRETRGTDPESAAMRAVRERLRRLGVQENAWARRADAGAERAPVQSDVTSFRRSPSAN
jgi:hypothetical protein